MMNVRKQFILYAMLAVFVLLGVLLTVINGVNFTMASEDADEITRMLSESRGSFDPGGEASRFEQDGRMGPMGPGSPEMRASVRYFTVAFDDGGNGRVTAFAISAVSEQEAAQWARQLLDRQDTGWTHGTYRYRVYRAEGQVFVTVIDQGRELLPCYRLLVISLVGLIAGLLVSFGALSAISRRLFRPLEETDRKQKRFLADVEQEFRAPLAAIRAETESLERRSGECDETLSIHRQVRHMTTLVRRLASLSPFDRAKLRFSAVSLSDLCRAAGDDMAPRFAQKGLTLETDVAPDITVSGDEALLRHAVRELLENARKFSRRRTVLSLRRQGDRVELSCRNDTELPRGSVEQVFDRFTRLPNAEGIEGAGLGLAEVKEIAKVHNARLTAAVSDGAFTVTVHL